MKANKSQLKAINANEGAHLVIASAGSGKTYTIIQRAVRLIKEGICTPQELLLLTFSRKAADELKKRIVSSLGEYANAIVASTFHSFCLQYVIQECMDAVTVLDEDNSETIMKEIIHNHIDSLFGIPSLVIYKIITKPGNNGNSLPADINDKIASIKEEYRHYKKTHNYIDFEDMINMSIEYLQNNTHLRSNIHNRFKYIMVDEFQDTSENNFKLLKLLLPEKNPNVFVVGDDWQSIYKFRNARIEYIVNARKYFDKLTVHSLNSNYRSKKEIVKISNRLIAKNKFRSRRFITAVRGSGGKVLLHKVHSFEEEALLADTIAQKYDADSVGILYRNNWQGDFLQYKMNNKPNLHFMTIHGAKGLEFDVVILCGIKDRLLPDPYTDIEEERRLMYVALTRAKNCLHIIYHPTYSNQKPQFIEECQKYL